MLLQWFEKIKFNVFSIFVVIKDAKLGSNWPSGSGEADLL